MLKNQVGFRKEIETRLKIKRQLASLFMNKTGASISIYKKVKILLTKNN